MAVLVGLLGGSPAAVSSYGSECLPFTTVQSLTFPGSAGEGYLVNLMLWKDEGGFPAGGVGVQGVLVDTGADGTFLPRSVAEELGLRLEQGRLVPVFGVGGVPIRIWEHPLRLALVSQVFPPDPCEVRLAYGKKAVRLLGPFEVPVGFPEDQGLDSKLLGREGVMDRLNVTFTPAEVHFERKPVN